MKHHLTNTLTIIAAALLFGLASFVMVRPVLADTLHAQTALQNGIREPEAGDTLSGIVLIQGTAAHESFLRYELAFSNGGDWIVFAEGDRPVLNGTLAIWDTTVGRPASPVFPDGVYRLRLRVVRQDYNYSEYFVRDLLLANEGLTPTPTATLTATVTSSTPTPAAPGEPAVQPAATEPALLPSLTPFPTPSPVATAADVILPAAGGGGRPDAGDSGERSGLFQRLQALEYGRLGTAFWQGARLAFLPFALLALYLLLRGLFRRLWRALWGRWQDGRRQDRVR